MFYGKRTSRMHPILSDFRKLLCYLAAWLLCGMLMAGLLVAAGVAPLRNALLFAIPVCLVYGFFALSAYYVCRSQPFARRSPFSAVVVFGAVSLAAGLAWLGLCAAWNIVAASINAEWASIALSRHLAAILFAAGFCFYLLSILLHDALIAFENMLVAERRAAQSVLLARDAELEVLRTQIDPHFLFNSLNSISALTAIDPSAARAMAIALGQFFRQTLALSARTSIPLADEIALCENFLQIEKIRFGNRLAVDIHIDPNTRSAPVPPLSLQPLVENAVKHGIRNMDDGGTITIIASAHERWLHITIENPINPQSSPIAGNGVGLKNSRLRFAALYGDQARIIWQQTGDQRFVVEITTPFEPVTSNHD